MSVRIPLEVISHQRKVCSLYKRVLKCVRDHVFIADQYRYEAVLIRQQFDENRGLTDPVKANQLIDDAEKKLFSRTHWDPMKHASSIGGVNYDRNSYSPDWVLDFWHPLEKAQYPKYFATREKRKKEYIEWYNRVYGKPKEDEEELH